MFWPFQIKAQSSSTVIFYDYLSTIVVDNLCSCNFAVNTKFRPIVALKRERVNARVLGMCKCGLDDQDDVFKR